MEKIDVVRLSLPLKPEYAGTARLTVSGIASRMGFDYEEIEDIKVAVSEIISKYITERRSSAEELSIDFTCYEDLLLISFYSKESTNCLFDENDELALSIISALMDDVRLCVEDERYQIIMSKSVREKKI